MFITLPLSTFLDAPEGDTIVVKTLRTSDGRILAFYDDLSVQLTADEFNVARVRYLERV